MALSHKSSTVLTGDYDRDDDHHDGAGDDDERQRASPQPAGGPAGVIGGRSVVARMPAGAAQT